MAIEDRKVGWLTAPFYYRFREILTHTAFRFGLACPIYCCMPDHLHLLWIGIDEQCDQRKASRFFRKRLNESLGRVGYCLQEQAYDHVLRDDERQEAAFQEIAEYIARNPERAGLVAPMHYREYKQTGCLVPGYPNLSPFEDHFWEKFWRIYSELCRCGFLNRNNRE